MKSICRNSIYMFKNMTRDMSFTFWELIYPIVLVSFFYVAFSGIMSGEIEDINLGIEKDNKSAYILETVDILNLVEIEKDDINRALENEKIDGFVNNDLNLLVNKSDLNQTIIKTILDQINQSMLLNESIGKLDPSVNYLKGEAQQSNIIIIIFYSLIAMVSAYGVFPGIEITNLVQANLTPLGARINTTPVKKSTLLISGIVVGLFMNLASNTLLLLFIHFILKLDIIANLPNTILFILLGNLFGISLGIFIGISSRKSEGFKSMLAIVSTLFLSFIAGLMSPDIKYVIEDKFPIVARINPMSIITNNLYRVNSLNSKADLNGALLLVLYSSILMMLSYMFLRRRRYDSI